MLPERLQTWNMVMEDTLFAGRRRKIMVVTDAERSLI